jgi:3-oxoadipate enol-lactonase
LTGKKQAQVVVLSHSLACSMVMWRPQLDLLESHFRVLRFDTRGHGFSDAPVGSYTLEQLVGDAPGLLGRPIYGRYDRARPGVKPPPSH